MSELTEPRSPTALMPWCWLVLESAVHVAMGNKGRGIFQSVLQSQPKLRMYLCLPWECLGIPLSGQRQCWAGLEIPRPLALPLFFRILHDPHTSHHHRASYVHCQMVLSITRGGLWHPHVPACLFWENGSKPSWFGDLRLWWLQCRFPALETALADFWSVVYLWEEGSGNFFRGLGVTQRFLGLRQG